jgi:NAD(P) transhydrogenase subunit alpha
MTMRIGVTREVIPGERRVALVPETVARLGKQGFEVLIEPGSGDASFCPDQAYTEAGARLVADRAALCRDADVLVKVQTPTPEEIAHYRRGLVVIAYLQPHRSDEAIRRLRDQGVTSFAMELVPRITRAQSMDALSSQGTVAGYKAVLLAADLCPQFFPMLTTAAGTIRPAKVLILGAGVAGLQAIATARRLGCDVLALDSGAQRAQAHKFYFREGMHIPGFCFRKDLKK